MLVLLLLALALLSIRCGADNPLAPDVRGDNEVWIQASGFEPTTLTVTAGTTVTWKNKDTEIHTVESGTPDNPDIRFTSPNIKASSSWSFKFDSKGTFDYYCSIHRNQAKIVVN